MDGWIFTEWRSGEANTHHWPPQKVNLDGLFTCTDANRDVSFFSSCSKVNSTGYSEFD